MRGGEGHHLSQRPDRLAGCGGAQWSPGLWPLGREGGGPTGLSIQNKRESQQATQGTGAALLEDQPEGKRTVYEAAAGAGLDTTVPHAALTPPRPLGKVGLTLDPQQASDTGTTRTHRRYPQTRAPTEQRAHGPGSSSAGSPASPPPHVRAQMPACPRPLCSHPELPPGVPWASPSPPLGTQPPCLAGPRPPPLASSSELHAMPGGGQGHPLLLKPPGHPPTRLRTHS